MRLEGEGDEIREWSEPGPDPRSHANNGKKTENANQSTLDIPNEISLLVTAQQQAVAHSRTSDHLTDSATRWPTSRALFLYLLFSRVLYKFTNRPERDIIVVVSNLHATATFIWSLRNPFHTLSFPFQIIDQVAVRTADDDHCGAVASEAKMRS